MLKTILLQKYILKSKKKAHLCYIILFMSRKAEQRLFQDDIVLV